MRPGRCCSGRGFGWFSEIATLIEPMPKPCDSRQETSTGGRASRDAHPQTRRVLKTAYTPTRDNLPETND